LPVHFDEVASKIKAEYEEKLKKAIREV